MKFTVAKNALSNGLHIVQNVVGVRNPLPILANVLVTTEEQKLWLTTTDLEVSVRCGVEAEIEEAGMTTMPVRRLSSIVRELPDASMHIEVDENDVASVECGTSFFKINGISQEDFPPVSNPEEKFCYHADQGVFREMLRKTAYAASTDETRFVLNGVLLSFRDGKLTMVATDGRRLALVESELDFPDEAQGDMILPTKAVQELLHSLGDEGDMKIFAKENQIVFDFGDILIASKLIDGTYPNFRQVIPTHCEQRVTVERERLLDSLRRTVILSTDKSSAAKVTLTENQLVLSITSPEVGEARETVAVRYNGPEMTVAFNPAFLIEPLRNLTSDEIYIELTDELSPGVIKCDTPFLYVLMPIRVS